MKFYTLSFLAVALATTAPVAAHAAEGSEASESELTESQEPIIVEGRRPEYGAKSTSTATKTRTEIKDVPQALSVVSEQQIEDQQLRSVSELLYFVPGATPSPGEGHRDQIVLRGNNSTADFFVDGFKEKTQSPRMPESKRRTNVSRPFSISRLTHSRVEDEKSPSWSA